MPAKPKISRGSGGVVELLLGLSLRVVVVESVAVEPTPDAPALAEAPAPGAPDEPGAPGAPVTHVFVILSPIKVTLPFRASARPFSVTPLASVIDVRAMIVPMKVEPDPRVAELVTCQKTLHEFAPLMSFTELPDAVTRSDAAWKTQTELGSFWPSSVKVPVSARAPPL